MTTTVTLKNNDGYASVNFCADLNEILLTIRKSSTSFSLWLNDEDALEIAHQIIRASIANKENPKQGVAA